MERLIQFLRGIRWDDLHHSSTKPSSKVDPPSCSSGLSSETVVELNKATGKFRKNDQGEGSALWSRKEDVPVGAVAAVTPLGIDSKFLLSRQGYLDVTSEDDPLFADYEVRELSKYMATYFSSLTAIENREHRRDVNKTKASRHRRSHRWNRWYQNNEYAVGESSVACGDATRTSPTSTRTHSWSILLQLTSCIRI